MEEGGEGSSHKRSRTSEEGQSGQNWPDKVTMDRGCDHSSKIQAWNPPFMLNGSPLPSNASIKDFQQGRDGYMADAVEQALLLLGDMADLRTMKKHEVFLSLKRDLALVSIV